MIEEAGAIVASYVYKAFCVSCYDADTITANISVGFGIWMHGQKLRLLGLDAPEVRGDERSRGLDARNALRGLIDGREIVVATKRDKKGKYGRWLATVYVATPEGGMMNVNEWLIHRGFAERRDY